MRGASYGLFSSQFSSCAVTLKLGGWWVCAESIARVGCSSQFSSCAPALELGGWWVCTGSIVWAVHFSVLQLCPGSRARRVVGVYGKHRVGCSSQFSGCVLKRQTETVIGTSTS